ncbi:hypothetical protein HZS_7038 [Henneguya salminicola]|nr:hypothetical protein HZS_7038 [Henneguya salminicola]
MFRRHWKGDFDGEMHQALIWSTDESLSLLRYNGLTLIEATYRTVPSSFSQGLIVLIYDRGLQTYVPCAYSLQTSKSEHMYCTILHELIVLTKYTWVPIKISSDFKQGLVNACKHEFSGSTLMGCYFHLNQALYRKRKKLIPNEKNNFNLLKYIELIAIVPIKEIDQAINLLNPKLIQTTILEEFWKYFVKIWIGCYGAKLWNIHEIDDKEIFV